MKKLIILLVLLTGVFAQAQTTWMVDSLNDSGFGSLRAAADSCAAGDTIRFNPNLIANGSDSIVLTTGEIAFDSVGVVLKGLYNSTDTLKISGNDSSRLFSFHFSGNVVLDSMVLANGKSINKGGAVYTYECQDSLFVLNCFLGDNNASSGGGAIASNAVNSNSVIVVNNSVIIGNKTSSFDGGGISSFSQYGNSALIISNSSVINNSALNGFAGGVYSYSGLNFSSINNTSSMVTIDNSSISGNFSNSGGGVYSRSLDSLSMVKLNNSKVLGNTSSGVGGGIYSQSSTHSGSLFPISYVIVDSSNISGNSAKSGGGIFSTVNFGYSNSGSTTKSSVIITSSTISGNTAYSISPIGNGGGVFCMGVTHFTSPVQSVVDITSSTISGNRAIGNGGGVFSATESISGNQSGPSIVSVTNSTLTENTALDTGNAVFSSTVANLSTINIEGSIVAENGLDSSGIFNTDPITINSNGYNIFSDSIIGVVGTDSLFVDSNQLNLQPLAINGGSTPTMIPGVGSVALNNGNPSDSSDAQNAPVIGIRNRGAAEDCLTNWTNLSAQSCYSYTSAGGKVFNESGTYFDTLTSGCGADSVLIIDLSITNLVFESISVCDSLVWRNGVTYFQSTSAYDTIVLAGGCDSVFWLDLTVYPSFSSIDTQIVCDSLIWLDGITYYANNDSATFLATSVSGCDSLVTLDLTVNHTIEVVDSISACLFYQWVNGQIYISDNNTDVYTALGSNGCDSIVHLDLEIHQGSFSVDSQMVCDSLVWIDGNTYYSDNNTATHTLVGGNSNGCDSIVTLNLTILNTTTYTDVITSCNPISWIDGVVYSGDNDTATFVLVNSEGCDSVVTLNFTLLHATSGVDVLTLCSSFTWLDGVTYTQSINGPTFTIQNNQGCDSVVTLDFTLLEVDTSVTRNYLTLISQATNATYQWIDCDNGLMAGETNASYTATANGNYQVEVTQNGCVDTSDCFAITNVGIGEVSLSNNINIYPNPVHDQVNIEITNWPTNGVEIVVRDMAGKKVYTTSVEPISTQETVTINTTEWAKGTYFIEVGKGEHRVVEQIVVQ